jgi:hypothetical protein
MSEGEFERRIKSWHVPAFSSGHWIYQEDVEKWIEEAKEEFLEIEMLAKVKHGNGEEYIRQSLEWFLKWFGDEDE